MNETLAFVAGFLLNMLVAFVIVRFIYYRRGMNNSFAFTFLAFNVIIYLIMGLFTSIEISIGTGFGLFALFFMLHYRTETIPIREMTYLFVMAALPIMNSILRGLGAWDRMLVIDLLMILILRAFDQGAGILPGSPPDRECIRSDTTDPSIVPATTKSATSSR